MSELIFLSQCLYTLASKNTVDGVAPYSGIGRIQTTEAKSEIDPSLTTEEIFNIMTKFYGKKHYICQKTSNDIIVYWSTTKEHLKDKRVDYAHAYGFVNSTLNEFTNSYDETFYSPKNIDPEEIPASKPDENNIVW